MLHAFADLMRTFQGGERPPGTSAESFMSVSDAARYLQVSTTTIRNLAVGG